MKRFNVKARLMAGLAMLVGSTAALAGGEGGLDYSTLTSAIDFDDVGPAVLQGAGALVALYVIVKGIKLIIGFVRGG